MTKDIEAKKAAFLAALEEGGFAISTNHSDGLHTLQLHFGRNDAACDRLRNALLDYGIAARKEFEANAMAS